MMRPSSVCALPVAERCAWAGGAGLQDGGSWGLPPSSLPAHEELLAGGTGEEASLPQTPRQAPEGDGQHGSPVEQGQRQPDFHWDTTVCVLYQMVSGVILYMYYCIPYPMYMCLLDFTPLELFSFVLFCSSFVLNLYVVYWSNWHCAF